MDRRAIDWRGSSYKDLCGMPEPVRRTFGYALGLAQNDLPLEQARTLAAFRPALVELLGTMMATLPGRLHGALSGRDLRPALLQEEVDARPGPAEAGQGDDRSPVV